MFYVVFKSKPDETKFVIPHSCFHPLQITQTFSPPKYFLPRTAHAGLLGKPTEAGVQHVIILQTP